MPITNNRLVESEDSIH